VKLSDLFAFNHVQHSLPSPSRSMLSLLQRALLCKRLGEICIGIRTKGERTNCWRQSLPNSDRIMYCTSGRKQAYCAGGLTSMDTIPDQCAMRTYIL
jgi:hypothetical protein